MSLPPLRFEPILREKPWGSETWQISARPEADSKVAEGDLKGRTLGELVRDHGSELLGAPGTFPLLVKRLDAKDWLSIQVHPLPETAEPGESPKTEAWFCLDARPGAEILLGLAEGSTVKDLKEGAERHLRRCPMKAGDGVLVPTGTVHAVGPGLVLAEIQENADTTYRLEDWGRKDRPLHREEALKTIALAPPAGPCPAPLKNLSCPSFTLSRKDVRGWASCPPTSKRFSILGVVTGSLDLTWKGGRTKAFPGSWWLLSAGLSACALEGQGMVLEVKPS